MCVIVVKKAKCKIKLGELEKILDLCYESNPDSMGYMLPMDDSILIRKGFTSVSSMLNSINWKEYHNKNIVFHFRIATSGKIDTTNSHPFPLSKNLTDFKNDTILAKMGICHNGVLNSTDDIYNGMFSDTLILSYSILSRIKDKSGIDFLLGTLAHNSNNKFALMDSTKVYLYGHFSEYQGLLVSNLNFTYKKYSTKKWIHVHDDNNTSDMWDSNGKFVWEYKEKEKGLNEKSISEDSIQDNYPHYEKVICETCLIEYIRSNSDIAYSQESYGMFICPDCETKFHLKNLA